MAPMLYMEDIDLYTHSSHIQASNNIQIIQNVHAYAICMKALWLEPHVVLRSLLRTHPLINISIPFQPYHFIP